MGCWSLPLRWPTDTRVQLSPAFRSKPRAGIIKLPKTVRFFITIRQSVKESPPLSLPLPVQCNAPSPYQDRQANAASRSALLCCDPTPISSPFIFRWHGIAWKKNQQSLLNSADRAFIFPCFHISATLLETGSSDYRILLPIRSCLRGIGAGLSFDSSDQIQIQRAGWVSYLLSGVCDLIRPQSPPEELFA